jgi:predicted metal-dependent hydrolase
MPLPAIDYVVAHELAHLKEMNHSPRFWSVVEGLCPDWRERRTELKRLGLTCPNL